MEHLLGDAHGAVAPLGWEDGGGWSWGLERGRFWCSTRQKLHLQSQEQRRGCSRAVCEQPGCKGNCQGRASPRVGCISPAGPQLLQSSGLGLPALHLAGGEAALGRCSRVVQWCLGSFVKCRNVLSACLIRIWWQWMLAAYVLFKSVLLLQVESVRLSLWVCEHVLTPNFFICIFIFFLMV